jgi:hypothetical protein
LEFIALLRGWGGVAAEMGQQQLRERADDVEVDLRWKLSPRGRSVVEECSLAPACFPGSSHACCPPLETIPPETTSPRQEAAE